MIVMHPKGLITSTKSKAELDGFIQSLGIRPTDARIQQGPGWKRYCLLDGTRIKKEAARLGARLVSAEEWNKSAYWAWSLNRF